MKREEMKAVLENAEMDIDAKLKAIMDANGKDLTDLKTSNKELTEKVKGFDELQTKFDGANKELETYKAFEEKAKKYDEILPAFEQYKKDEKIRKVKESAMKSGIKEEFVEFAYSKVGDVEDIDNAFKKFAEDNKQFTNAYEKVISTNPEVSKGKAESVEDFSKIY